MGPPPDLSEASDQEVVAWARQDSEEACRELMDRYLRRVLSVIYQVVRHRERAEDLTQVTFAKVFLALDRYRPERRFAPWILRIAHNTAVDYVRLERFDSWDSPYLVTPGQIDARAMYVPTRSDTLTPRPDTRLTAAELEQALRGLRREYRRCVVLRFLEERSYDDIAEIMNVPVGTVGTYLHRARKQLKRTLGPLLDSSFPSDPDYTTA